MDGRAQATTVPRCGWAEVKNGKLLVLAALKFVFFLVMDKNHEYHQNIATMPIAVLFVGTVINQLEPLAPRALSILREFNYIQLCLLREIDA
jgi:hypothetical protein